MTRSCTARTAIFGDEQHGDMVTLGTTIARTKRGAIFAASIFRYVGDVQVHDIDCAVQHAGRECTCCYALVLHERNGRN